MVVAYRCGTRGGFRGNEIMVTSNWNKQQNEVLISEPVPVTEEFVSGLGYFEIVGEVTFLVFVVDQVMLPAGPRQPRERRVARKMIMTNAARRRMRRMLDAADALDRTAQPADEIAEPVDRLREFTGAH